MTMTNYLYISNIDPKTDTYLCLDGIKLFLSDWNLSHLSSHLPSFLCFYFPLFLHLLLLQFWSLLSDITPHRQERLLATELFSMAVVTLFCLPFLLLDLKIFLPSPPGPALLPEKIDGLRDQKLQHPVFIYVYIRIQENIHFFFKETRFQ